MKRTLFFLVVCLVFGVAPGCGYDEDPLVDAKFRAEHSTRTYIAQTPALVAAIQKAVELAGYEVELVARDYSLIRTKPRKFGAALHVSGYGLWNSASSVRLYVRLARLDAGRTKVSVRLRLYTNGFETETQITEKVRLRLWNQIHENIKDALGASYVNPQKPPTGKPNVKSPI